jgi:hypothetical protein
MAESRTNDAQRSTFLDGLGHEDRPHFYGLEQALQQPSSDLDWYFQVGRLVARLQDCSGGSKYGASWMRRLTAALGIKSHNLLTKPLAFARRFAKQSDLARLKRLGVSWSAVVATMPLGDLTAQFEMLQRVAAGGWPASRVRREVRRAMMSRHAHQKSEPPQRTGRTPRPVTDAPEVELQGLLSRAKAWARYVDASWLAPDGTLLRGLHQRGRIPVATRRLLQDTETALMQVAQQVERLRREFRQLAENGRSSEDS